MRESVQLIFTVQTGNRKGCYLSWNGGGASRAADDGDNYMGTGGGATSIQTSLIGDGQLSNYAGSQSDVLLVAGGGGGSTKLNGDEDSTRMKTCSFLQFNYDF